ncbi:MAG TPA: DUF1848 domain-containing protein [archaeon]|nr:DUF1848 domain-containing protein [archaeon]
MNTVISASRRTDIPAFCMDWFLARLKLGSFLLTNPFNGQVRTVKADRDRVCAIVFWSKNFGPLLERAGELTGWPSVFNFTLNSEDRLLEPRVPPLKERLAQMRTLVELYGARAVRWRFDPVVFYQVDGRVKDNLGAFEFLLDFAAGLKIKSCTISFMDPYRKIAAREKLLAGFRFIYPEPGLMFEKASWMARRAAERGIKLFTCCEAGLSSMGIENLRPGRCIDHRLISQVYGCRLSGKPDTGQRRSSGCLCHQSVDIGSYREQPCRCGCLYCYANPIVKGRD